MSCLGFWARVAGCSATLLASAVVVAPIAGAWRPGSWDAESTRSSFCRAKVLVGVLPVWARGGFSDPQPRMPYVLGRARKIAAILWADPLQLPPPRDHNNKILWVSHGPSVPGSDLRINASE
jgi:hypothetical protein